MPVASGPRQNRDKIPSALYRGAAADGGYNPYQKFRASLKNEAVANGFYEIATYSFISPSAYDRIGMPADDERRNSIKLINPLGEDTSVMRTVALPSMLDVVAYNRNRKAEKIALFECATVYYPTEDGMSDERKEFVLAMDGMGDFYDLKGYVEALLDSVNVKAYKVESCTEAGFHPGICARLINGKKVLGVFGQIHPAVADNYNFNVPVYVCELDMEALYDARRLMMDYKPLPKYPALERDFSFVCDESVEAASVASVIRGANKLVASVSLFDIYRGPQIGENKKSMSYAVMLRAADRTLTDAEADAAVSDILAALESGLGIKLR